MSREIARDSDMDILGEDRNEEDVLVVVVKHGS